jgi:hypothetical protein
VKGQKEEVKRARERMRELKKRWSASASLINTRKDNPEQGANILEEWLEKRQKCWMSGWRRRLKPHQ